MGTIRNNWKVDHKKFRIYLKDKYKVENAYYFMGYFSENRQRLYEKLQEAGFILIFKKHHFNSDSSKKGNVDSDIIFRVMKNLLENNDFNQIILVSGDGDYFDLVNFLLKKDRFCKILFPNKKFASSLYKKLRSRKYDYLDNIKSYIEHK